MIDLDSMLVPEQAAKWLQMKPATLLAKSKGWKAVIPAFRLNSKVVRYHPRTIIAKMAADAGVKAETIAASLGFKIEKETK